MSDYIKQDIVKKDGVLCKGDSPEIMHANKIPCEIYSRVVGYYRPVGQWNKGKKEEYKNRQAFNNAELEKIVNKETESVVNE